MTDLLCPAQLHKTSFAKTGDGSNLPQGLRPPHGISMLAFAYGSELHTGSSTHVKSEYPLYNSTCIHTYIRNIHENKNTTYIEHTAKHKIHSYRQTLIHTHIRAYIRPHTHAYLHTDRDRQTDRQIDRQTHTQTCMHAKVPTYA